MSHNIARVLMDGRLTGDPELKVVGNNKTVAKFSIAVNHQKVGEREDTSYFEIETWGKTAEACTKYLKKGYKITVEEGSLKQQRWIAADGTPRSKVIIVAHKVRFDSPPKKKDESDNSSVDTTEDGYTKEAYPSDDMDREDTENLF